MIDSKGIGSNECNIGMEDAERAGGKVANDGLRQGADVSTD